MIEVIDDTAHTNVGTLLQYLRNRQGAIASLVPIVVFHGTTVHHVDTAITFNGGFRSDFPILQCHHDAACLEGRTWFPQGIDGIVLHFVVFACACFFIFATRQAHHRLDVACSHLHQDDYTFLTTHFLQFVADGLFCNVLHCGINGAHQVVTIDGFAVDEADTTVTHLCTMHDAILASQEGVVAPFQSACALCRVFGNISQHATGK